MNDATGQFGVGGSTPDDQGQSKVNPMSPTFMGPAANFAPPPPPATPSNPPIGGLPPSPPPPPPLPPMSPPTSPAPSAYGMPPAAIPVPPPPAKEVDIRTMASDQQSMKASGGLEPAPMTITPPTASVNVKKIDLTSGTPKRKASGNKRALLIGLGIVIVLGAAAAVANYIVLPMFLNKTADLPEAPEVVAPVVEPEPEEAAPILPAFTHQSFFATPADSVVKLGLGDTGLASIKGSVSSAAANALATGTTLTEFYLTTGADQPVTSAQMLGALLPDLVLAATPLEEDFTGFVYSDGTTAWPGYVFAVDSAATDKELLKSILGQDLEASGALANLFLTDPGVASTVTFNNGSAVGELTGVRYVSYAAPGASLNYGWKGDRLVISTSFNGLKAVASKIGTSASLTGGLDGTVPDAGVGGAA